MSGQEAGYTPTINGCDGTTIVDGVCTGTMGPAANATEAIDDVAMSLKGITLLLNNGFKESQQIFDQYK